MVGVAAMLLEKKNVPGSIVKELFKITLDGLSRSMMDTRVWSSDDLKAFSIHSPGQVYVSTGLKLRIKPFEFTQYRHSIRCISGNDIGSIMKRKILRRKLLLSQIFGIGLHPCLWLSLQNLATDTPNKRV